MSYAGAEGISGAFRAALKTFVHFFWDILHVKIRFCSHLQPSRDGTTCLRIQLAQKRKSKMKCWLVHVAPGVQPLLLCGERPHSAAETSPERGPAGPGTRPPAVQERLCAPGSAFTLWLLGRKVLLPAPWGVRAGATLPSQGKPAHSALGPRGTTYRCPQTHPWGCCQEPSFPRTRSLRIQSACSREEVLGLQGQRQGETEAPPRARGQCPIVGYRTHVFSDDAGVWTDGDIQHSVGITRALGRLNHVPSLFLFLETLSLGSRSSSCWTDIHAEAPEALSPLPHIRCLQTHTRGAERTPDPTLCTSHFPSPDAHRSRARRGLLQGRGGTGRTVYMPGPLSAQGDRPCFSLCLIIHGEKGTAGGRVGPH